MSMAIEPVKYPHKIDNIPLPVTTIVIPSDATNIIPTTTTAFTITPLSTTSVAG